MLRYCKQRDLYSCGPIALLNLTKWFFSDTQNYWTLHDLNGFKRLTHCDKDGTSISDFDRVLRLWFGKKNVRKTREWNIITLYEWVKAGNAIAFSHVHNDNYQIEEHFAICVEVQDGRFSETGTCYDSFAIINDVELKETITWKPWFIFQELLNKRFGRKKSCIWLIRKRDNA